MNLVGRSFLKLEDFNPGDLRYLLDLAKTLKPINKNGVLKYDGLVEVVSSVH